MALEQITFNLGALDDAANSGKNYVSGQVFEVFNIDDTYADIFADSAGTIPIDQSGIQNISNSDGECKFFIDKGFYNIKSGGKARQLNANFSFEFETVSDAINARFISLLEGRRVYINERSAFFNVVLSSSLFGGDAEGKDELTSIVNSNYGFKLPVEGKMFLENFGGYNTLNDIQEYIDRALSVCKKLSFLDTTNPFRHSDIITVDSAELDLNGATLLSTDTTDPNPQHAIKLTGYNPILKCGFIETTWTGTRQQNSNSAAVYSEVAVLHNISAIFVRGTATNKIASVGFLESNSSYGTTSNCISEHTHADGFHDDWGQFNKHFDLAARDNGDDAFATVSYINGSGYPRAKGGRWERCDSINTDANVFRVSGGEDIVGESITCDGAAASAVNIQVDAVYNTMDNENITVNGVTGKNVGALSGRVAAVSVLGQNTASSNVNITVKDVNLTGVRGVGWKVGNSQEVELEVKTKGGGSCTFAGEMLTNIVGLKVTGRGSTVTEHGIAGTANAVYDDVDITEYELHNINTSASATKDGINIPASATVSNFILDTIKLKSTNTLRNLIFCQHYDVAVRNCYDPNHNISVGASGNGECRWLEQSSKTKLWMTAPPTTGSYFQGSKVYNSLPVVNGDNMVLDHWVCTVSGTPGTWVAQYISTVTPAT